MPRRCGPWIDLDTPDILGMIAKATGPGCCQRDRRSGRCVHVGALRPSRDRARRSASLAGREAQARAARALGPARSRTSRTPIATAWADRGGTALPIACAARPAVLRSASRGGSSEARRARPCTRVARGARSRVPGAAPTTAADPAGRRGPDRIKRRRRASGRTGPALTCSKHRVAMTGGGRVRARRSARRSGRRPVSHGPSLPAPAGH
jgi:hypothetical protein